MQIESVPEKGVLSTSSAVDMEFAFFYEAYGTGASLGRFNMAYSASLGRFNKASTASLDGNGRQETHRQRLLS